MLKRHFLRHLLGAALLSAAGAALAAPAPKVLVLGDSLSAEYGLPRETGWVKLLADRLRQQGFPHEVVNASISGETTSGGRTRLPALLKEYQPAIVVVELGANDGLRGLPLATMRANLVAMIDASRATGARVLLVGIRVPPNYGREYSERFFATFAELAREKKVALAPFLLDGFAEKTESFQPDRIHPAQSAQPQMLDNVWPHLRPLLGAPRDGR